MQNSVEISTLDEVSLDDRKNVNEISYWLKVLNRPNGWHYYLDQLWILEELKKNNIRTGDTIIDAGAGQGVMQYLLAARGYNVISIDFSPRRRPLRTRGIFTIKGNGEKNISYKHKYMNVISYEGNLFIRRISKLFSFFTFKGLRYFSKRLLNEFNSFIFYIFELLFKDHSLYGEITYIRAPFHQLPKTLLRANALYSISAIEHSDIDIFQENIDSLLSLCRDNAPVLITTSLSDTDETTYDNKVEGWCFSTDFLISYFPNAFMSIDKLKCKKSITSNKPLWDKLDDYYSNDEYYGYGEGLRANIPYLPIYIKLIR